MIQDPAAATAIEIAAAHVRAVGRHARALEYLASGIASLGLLVAAHFALGANIGGAALVVMGSLTAWGLVRSVALLLYLKVDETMLALAED